MVVLACFPLWEQSGQHLLILSFGHGVGWRDSPNGIYGMWAERISAYSVLMLAARITLPHFSVSSAMSLPKSAGEPGSTAPPRSASRAFILGSARAALISLLRLSMISTGVPFGAPTPNQSPTS